MKTIFTLLLVLASLSFTYCQRGNKWIGNYLRIGSNIGYSNFHSSYTYNESRVIKQQDIILEFITPTSGTFELEKDSIFVSSSANLTTPKRYFNFGMSVQTIRPNGKFHEISLTNISFSQFDVISEDIIFSSDQSESGKRLRGQTTNLFQFGLRYEYGTHLRDMRSRGPNLALSLFVRPNFNFLEINYKDGFSGSLKANEISLHLGIGSKINFKLSSRVHLELAAYPSVELFNSKDVKRDQSFDFDQKFTRNSKTLPIYFEGLFSLKYAIKAPYRKGRKMSF